MNILIFGATGSIGRQLVTQALEQGHVVTAYSRDPAKLQVQHDKLKLVKGNAMELASVEQAMSGQDAVLCSIGAGAKGKVRANSTRNIVQAMEKTSVRRLVCQSTLGVGDSWNNLSFFWKYIMFGGLLRQAYADHVSQEDYVRKSDLDWIIVRPAAFTDGPLTSDYRHGFSTADKTTTLKISRADVADFMLKQLTDNSYLHKMPGLSY